MVYSRPYLKTLEARLNEPPRAVSASQVLSYLHLPKSKILGRAKRQPSDEAF